MYFIFRSESPSQVFFIILTWLIALVRSSAIKPEELDSIYLAYDNMCNLCRLKVARRPLALKAPLDRGWLRINKSCFVLIICAAFETKLLGVLVRKRMPPKRKSPKAATATCAICNTEVENSKDESLQCQSCNQKFHRYCAGAALTEYKMYENGSPYEYFYCYKVHNESTVTDLKDCIEALKSEILELRSTVQELSNKVEAAEAKNRKTEPSWSQVVRRGKKKPLKQKQGAAYAESQSTEQSRVTRQADCLTSNAPRARKLNNARKSVKAVGARSGVH